jgi:D-lactate dehydrogenase (cytochrome)
MAEVSKSVQAITKKHGGANFEFSKSDAEATAIWQGRKAALWSVLALKEGAKVWTTDVWYVPLTSYVRAWSANEGL